MTARETDRFSRRSEAASETARAASGHGRQAVVVVADPADYADDNIAILMLLRSEATDVRAIVTTSGNTCAKEGAAAARRLLAGAGAPSLPVLEGLPLAWHEDRLRFYEEKEKPFWPRNVYVGAFADRHACADAAGETEAASAAADLLLEQARARPGSLDVLLTGPATTLAEALKRRPELRTKLRRIAVMGGALEVPGNVTPHAEFNVWFDPEAMQTVLSSDVPITLVPLDATMGLTYPAAGVSPGGSPGFIASYVADYLERAAARGKPVRMWDEVLAAISIDPTLIEASETRYLSVSTEKDDRYGMILTSPTPAAGRARPVEIVTRVHAGRLQQLVHRLLRGE